MPTTAQRGVSALRQRTRDQVRISALKQYQRPLGAGRFDDLRPGQRAAAEAHYQRLCAKWGDDLPQWRKAILVGRAKDLVLRPRDAEWARRLRKGRGRGRQHSASGVRPGGPPRPTTRQGNTTLQRGDRASPPTQVASLVAAGHSASYRTRANTVSPSPANVASPPPRPNLASSLPEPSTPAPPSPHAVRLDIRGLTASGRDGQDSAEKILHDLERRAFSESPHFSIAVPGADLPAGWMWRLEVVPVS